MNRKNLTAAVLAGLAGVAGIVGSAQAVNINPDGLGQVLIYPYYTVNGGNMTLLSVVNTSENAKAVKVRFLEGQNSREVLDFNLYMSKYDVWTASLKNVDGTPRMKTADTSCTVPYIYGNGGKQDFLPWALDDGYYNDLDATGKPSKVYDDISRAAEGHFEMIEMGTLVDDEVENSKWVDLENFPYCEVGSAVTYGNPSGACPVGLDRPWTAAELAQPAYLTPFGSATAATHKDGVPNDCQQLVDAWTYGATSKDDGYWLEDNFYDIDKPSGGLFGGAAIVNVQKGTMYSYDAKAIDGFYDGYHAGDNSDDSHQEPGTILPSLDSGGNTDGIVFFNGNEQHSTGLSRGVDAVSFVFMHDQVMNEYTTEAAVGAGTEWVITFPTKQFYVYEDFLTDYEKLRNPSDPDDAYGTDPSGNWAPIAPFTSEWFWHTTTYKSSGAVNKEGYQEYPCEVVRLDTIWDREEGTIVDPEAPSGTPTPPIVSPAPPPGDTPDPDGIIPFELCFETSVIEFGPEGGDATAILGSTNFHNIDNTQLGFDYGWARLDMVDATWDEDQNGTIDSDEADNFRENLGGLYGLPVTGFAVQAFQNAFLGDGADVMANYGGIFQHKYTRSMTSRVVD